MTRSAVATLFLAVSSRAGADNVMYPDWSGGAGTCLNSTLVPASNYLFITANNYLEATLVSCCTRYYPNTAYNDCITGGGGTVTGSGEYYALWTDNPPRCAADCATTAGPQCGGLLGPGQQASYATAEQCCASHYGSLNQEYCVEISGGGTWGGTGKFYLDSSENICVKDCDGSAPCGGVVKENWVSLYNTIEDCCSNKLSSLPQAHCVSQSTPGSTGTNLWFVSHSDNICKKDCEGSGSECGNYVNGELDDTAASCCSDQLSWIADQEYCKSRSDPATYGVNGEPYTGKWFVDYNEAVCFKDCATSSGDPACADIEGGNKHGPSTPLYASESICCETKLGWLDKDSCETASVSGAALSSSVAAATGTLKWYADYSSAKRCVMDCPKSSSTPCNGVVDTSVSKYDSVDVCCSTRFGWYQKDLCKAISEGAGTGSTGKWYVDYQNEACVQDCAEGGGVACAGNPESFSEPLYDNAKACCSAKLGYVGAACENKSQNGASSPTVGTDQWHPDYTGKKCVKDCATGAGTGCNGILKQTNGVKMFDTAAACCSGAFNWINKDVCEARSNGSGHSNLFYPDQSKAICMQDCTGGTPCGGAPKDLSVPMYTDIASCCKTSIGWQNANKCAQTPESESGTEEYYISWTLKKCVKNCPTSQGGACGGLAENWDGLFGSSSTCCSQPYFSWMPAKDCLKS
mmetsp:Transcript_35828/g.76501  ORF Transcript_35828/g.76501 Transcript_35828/m.76501 type:complete len:691 (+) Transcript_35828:139-2211(+)